MFPSSQPQGGSAFDFLSKLTEVGGTLAMGLMQQKAAKKAAKAASGVGQFRPLAMGFSGATGFEGINIGGDISMMPAVPADMSGVTSGGSSTAEGGLFRARASTRVSPLGTIQAVNPVTGRLHCWRHVGSPILYSLDVSHCRRVNKILGRARRGGRARRKR